MTWLGPTISAVGGLLSGGLNSLFSTQQADKNRDFQSYMSNTAHQREVADLRKAGLNPILSAMGGHGASTPTGSLASPSFDSIGNAANSIASYFSPLYREQVKTQRAITRKEDALTLQSQAQTDLFNAEMLLKESQNALNVAKISDIYEDVKQKNIENRFKLAGSKLDFHSDGTLSVKGERRYYNVTDIQSDILNTLGSFDYNFTEANKRLSHKIGDVKDALFERIKQARNIITATHENSSKDVPSAFGSRVSRTLKEIKKEMNPTGIPWQYNPWNYRK